MKKKLLALVVACLSYFFLSAQEFRINAFAGYVFDDHVESSYTSTSGYEGTIKGGFRWGAGLEYMVNPAYGINLIYLNQATDAPITYYDPNPPGAGLKNQTLDLTAHWIMLGGARYMRKDKIEPYGGFEIGMVISDLKSDISGNSASNTNFAWGVKLGTNIYFSEKVGLKIQADLRSATQAAGGGFYFGTGGAGVGVSSYSTIYQFGLGGGLVFRFPKK